MTLRTATIIILASLFVAQASAICNLCPSGVPGIRWPFDHIDEHGTTCSHKAIDMAKIQDNSGACQSEIAQFRPKCCSDRRPQQILQAPTRPPVYSGPTGTNPSCDICRDGDYPSQKSMVITMLYLGSGSCAQYYDFGRAGFIPAHLCDTLKFFAYEPCGCGQFNPNFNPNHPLNQQAQQAPQQNNNNNANTDYEAPQRNDQFTPYANSPPTPTARPTLAPAASPQVKPTNSPPAQTLSIVATTERKDANDGSNAGREEAKIGNGQGRGGQGGGGMRRLQKRYLKGGSRRHQELKGGSRGQ